MIFIVDNFILKVFNLQANISFVRNSKAVGGIVVGIAIIAIVALYAFNQEQENVSNEILVEPEEGGSVAISDSVTLTQNNPNYEIDEEGNKKYVISVIDVPELED